jgi:hypothetical protein
MLGLVCLVSKISAYGLPYPASFDESSKAMSSVQKAAVPAAARLGKKQQPLSVMKTTYNVFFV